MNVTILVIGIVTLVIRGFAVQTCWLWFISPLGAPPVGFWHSLGIVSAYNVLRWYCPKAETNTKLSKDDELVWALTNAIGVCVTWAIAWMMHLNVRLWEAPLT